MPINRVFTLVAASMVAGSVASAQQPRLFRDSWFWGAKVGLTTISTKPTSGTTSNSVAPSIGGEWLITRTQGALYLAYDQALFSATTYVPDVSAPALERQVRVKDLRRVTIALLAFPKQFGSLRPYAGAGLGINIVGSATPQGTFSSSGARTQVFSDVNARKSGASPEIIGGIHADYHRASVFGQATLITFTDRFLLNGTSPLAIDFGLRFNLAPAKERPDQR